MFGGARKNIDKIIEWLYNRSEGVRTNSITIQFHSEPIIKDPIKRVIKRLEWGIPDD